MLEWIISSCVLTAAVMLLRRLLKGKISLRLQYALWALVLLRLLVPVSFGSSALSIENAVKKSPVAQAAELTRNIDEIERLPDGSVRGYAPGDYMRDYPTVVAEGGTEKDFSRMESVMTARDVLMPVWLCGLGAVLAVFAVSNARLGLRLRRSREKLEVRGSLLPVYVSGAVETPCLFGFFSPVIYVTPEAARDETLLRHSVAHETTHYRHGDNIWAILRCVCLALHWYNPLVWRAAALSCADAELACDEATVRRLGESERAEYGRTLIGMTGARRAGLLVAATAMAGGGSIKQRIRLLAKRPKTAAAALAFVLFAAVAAVGCAFTGAKASEPAAEEIEITVDDGVVIPAEATEIMLERVRADLDYRNSVGAERGYRITDARISGVTGENCNPGVTGAYINDDGTAYSFGLYRLEYRLKPDKPENVMLAGGMRLEDGWITEWGSTGQPYLLFVTHFDASGKSTGTEFVCAANTDIIQVEYGTEEMLQKYGNAYAAAAAELYAKATGQSASGGTREFESAESAFELVLTGQGEFFSVDAGEFLRAGQLAQALGLTGEVPVSGGSFAAVDMDGDGIKEAVLAVDVNGESFGYIVLRFDGGVVNGCFMPYRAMTEIKADGTFGFSGGAADSGIGRLSFSGAACEIVPLSYTESATDEQGNLTVSYFVDGRSAGAGDYQAAFDRQSGKSDAQWFAATPESIEAAFSK